MDARLRLPRAWVALPVLFAVLLVAAASARAQGPLPVTTPIEPVTPPVEPVTPPVEPVTPPAEPVTPPALPVTPAPTPTTSPFAVVLVSGFNTSTPFSTPACPTSGRGSTWDEATGPAPAIAAEGYMVFTAPVANGGQAPPASCLGGMGPDIPSGGSMVINSNGELSANQQALVNFLTFLHQNYGVTTVALVGHSDGGLWSRAAISQLISAGSPVTIASLTTVGTPHTGSFGADLAMAVNAAGGSCQDLTDPIEQDVCNAAYAAVQVIFANLGQDVIEELSSSWLSQWNPTTSINCAVTTLGGNHVGWDLGVGTYYSANDGIVGQASALNQGTWIPWVSAAPFTPVAPPGGLPQLYDAVHSESLSFLSPNWELNTPALAAAVAATVQNAPPGPCASATSSLRGRALRAPAATAPATAAAAAKPVTVEVPLHARDAVRNGSFNQLHTGDGILLLKGASVRCDGRKMPAVPLLGSQRVRLVVGACRSKLTVRGRALRLTQSPAKLHLTRSGKTLRYRLTGPPLKRVNVQVRTDGKWRTVRGGRVTVPTRDHKPAVRVTAIAPNGRTVHAATKIAV
jgi:hypothetical protein